MAKPNYQYEKRQRELEKKKKKAEKAQRKTTPGSDESSADDSDNPDGFAPTVPFDPDKKLI